MKKLPKCSIGKKKQREKFRKTCERFYQHDIGRVFWKGVIVCKKAALEKC